MSEWRSEGDVTHLWACELLFGILQLLTDRGESELVVRVNFSPLEREQQGEHLLKTLVIARTRTTAILTVKEPFNWCV